MISIFTQGIVYKTNNKKILKKWLIKIAEQNNKSVGILNIIFCSNSNIKKLNKKFLKHDYYTDVITFDYSDIYKKKKIFGDIFISIHTVRKNAKIYNVSFHNELLRIMSHGILHLIGYKDDTEINSIEMKNNEDISIKLYNELLINADEK